jgi:adenylate cyclase
MADDLDIINTIFEHRLQQDDLDRILNALSLTDRNELINKIGDLLNRISALVEVSNSVSSTLSLDIILPRLMEVVTEALNADRSSVFLYDAETQELFSRFAQGGSVGEIRFPSGSGIAGSVLQSGIPLIIPDAYADDRFNPEVDHKTGYRTRNILCAPLKNKRQKIIGVTQVLNKLTGDFGRDDLTLLEALTSQAAAALENAQLFEQVERARHEESRLLEITSDISSELQLEALLVKIVHVTTEMLDADRSTLFLFDAKTNELWSLVAEGLDTKEIRFPAGAGIAGSCLTSGEVINIPDAYVDERFNPEVDRKTGYRTRVCR